MTGTVSSTDSVHRQITDTPGHPAGDGVIKPEYDDRLANSDLVPLKKQTWSSYNTSPSGCPTCTASAAT